MSCQQSATPTDTSVHLDAMQVTGAHSSPLMTMYSYR